MINMFKKAFLVPYEDSSRYPTAEIAKKAIEKYCRENSWTCVFLKNSEVEIDGVRYEIIRRYGLGGRGNYGIKCRQK